MPPHDATLLQQFAATGDQRAFAEIVQMHVNALYSVALRRVNGDEHLAREIVQDVFISLSQHAASLGPHPCLIGWLYSATRNAAANRIRSEVRRRNREQKAHAMENFHPEAQKEIAWAQLAPFLEEEIDRLGQTDRHAILLRFFEQHSFAEIGNALSISEDGARMRVDRALEKLRQLLARRGIHSTGAALGATLITSAVGAAPATLAIDVTGAALQTVPSPWDHLSNLWNTFRPVEKMVVLVSGVIVAGAWMFPLAIHPVASPQVDEHAEIASLKQELQTLRNYNSRQVQIRRQLEHEAATARQAVRPSAVGSSMLAGGRRAVLSANYNAFYRSQGFTAAQIDQFETLQLQAPATSVLWLYHQPAASSADLTLPSAEVEARLRSQLGKEAFQQYQQYNRLLPAWNAACQVAAAVYMTEPLARTESERLVELLVRASADYQAGGNLDLASLDWESVLAEAAKTLSPAQCTALAGVRNEAVFQRALAQRVNQLSAVEPQASLP